MLEDPNIGLGTNFGKKNSIQQFANTTNQFYPNRNASIFQRNDSISRMSSINQTPNDNVKDNMPISPDIDQLASNLSGYQRTNQAAANQGGKGFSGSKPLGNQNVNINVDFNNNNLSLAPPKIPAPNPT